MFDSTTHWSVHAVNAASLLCNGILAARVRRREQRRATEAESAVPPHWRVRPPAEPPRPEAPAPAPAQPNGPGPSQGAAAPERLPIEPLTLPPPVAPWDMPRSSSGVRRARAEEARRPSAPPSSPTSAASSSEAGPSPAGSPPSEDPQLELNFAGAARCRQDELTHVTDAIGVGVTLIGEVVGDAVAGALAEGMRSLEQRHAEEREHLVQRLEAALERQAARFAEALERQAEAVAAAMARHAAAQADSLRAMVREVAAVDPGIAPDVAAAAMSTEILAELQETVRSDLSAVRAAFDRHHDELIEVVRSELRPAARAATPRFMPPPRPPTRDAAIPEPRRVPVTGRESRIEERAGRQGEHAGAADPGARPRWRPDDTNDERCVAGRELLGNTG